MNTYTDDSGIPRSYIQARRRRKSALLEVIDRCPAACEQSPDTSFGVIHGQLSLSKSIEERVSGGTVALYTRIWMMMAPPAEGHPGWAGVLGEVFDGNWRQQERTLVLLDEACAVLLPRLFFAAACLKDIYMADQLYVDPSDAAFRADLAKNRWGLCGYDADMDDDDLASKFPFFASRDRICSPIEPPYKPDPEWGRLLISEMFDDGMLKVHSSACPVFERGNYKPPHRALALGVMAMQAWDWSDRFDGVDMDDGYEDEGLSPAEFAQAQRAKEHMANVLYMTGDTFMRSAVERAEASTYESMAPPIERPLGSLSMEDLSWLG
uniref:Uncharacterized protein n=1 Tax=viral metagenome TaxID=1070528 RepID=A0A6M3XSZ4_9ZZZZ